MMAFRPKSDVVSILEPVGTGDTTAQLQRRRFRAYAFPCNLSPALFRKNIMFKSYSFLGDTHYRPQPTDISPIQEVKIPGF
jgi:hypothetical protein